MGEERKILGGEGDEIQEKGGERGSNREEGLSREREGRGRMGGDEERDNSP